MPKGVTFQQNPMQLFSKQRLHLGKGVTFQQTYQQKFLLFSLIIIFILAVAAYFLYPRLARTQPPQPTPIPWQTYKNQDLGVKFSYPGAFQVDVLTEDDKKAGIIFRAVKPNPSALVSLRVEKDLGILRAFGSKDILTNLIGEINRRYPDRFPEYKKEKYEEIILANERAAFFEFTYLGVDGETRIKQRLVIVVRSTTAYYLSFQSPENQFLEPEQEFSSIMNSFEFLD